MAICIPIPIQIIEEIEQNDVVKSAELIDVLKNNV